MKKSIRISSRVRLVLDSADQDTPAMVYGRITPGQRETASATFYCATDTGELIDFDGADDDVTLNAAELKALNSYRNTVDTL